MTDRIRIWDETHAHELDAIHEYGDRVHHFYSNLSEWTSLSQWGRINSFQTTSFEWRFAQGPKRAAYDVLAVFGRLEQATYLALEHIDVDSMIRGGVPVLRGTRFTIAQVLAEVADGSSVADLTTDYDLERSRIVGALRSLAAALDRQYKPLTGPDG
jgi:uncharacterized protein (DUF433 family)